MNLTHQQIESLFEALGKAFEKRTPKREPKKRQSELASIKYFRTFQKENGLSVLKEPGKRYNPTKVKAFRLRKKKNSQLHKNLSHSHF